jgi:hypothetical protein
MSTTGTGSMCHVGPASTTTDSVAHAVIIPNTERQFRRREHRTMKWSTKDGVGHCPEQPKGAAT